MKRFILMALLGLAFFGLCGFTPLAVALAIVDPGYPTFRVAGISCLSLLTIFVLVGRAYCKSMDARAKQVGVG